MVLVRCRWCNGYWLEKINNEWYYISEDGTMAEKPDFTVEPEGLITVK